MDVLTLMSTATKARITPWGPMDLPAVVECFLCVALWGDRHFIALQPNHETNFRL